MKKIFALMIIIILICTGCGQSSGVSNKKNATVDKNAVPEAPFFSREGGWYTKDFSLDLKTNDPGSVIYYTTDGSKPDAKSKKYTEPIKIEARYGQVSFTSPLEYGKTDYRPPKGPVFMGTVIRAAVMGPNGTFSQVVTHTYFVGLTHSRYTLPVVSLSFNNEDMFGDEKGIYVPGKVAAENDKESVRANFTMRGDEWERPVHIEFFEPDGKNGFSMDAGIRIHGGGTRIFAQKSLRIYARDSYGKNVDNIDYNIFPGLTDAYGKPLTQFKRIVLRNSGNDWTSTLFRDALMQDLVSHTDLGAQASRPSVVFLNGQYWGIYNIRERFDQYYVQNKYGIPKEDIVILEVIHDQEDAALSYGEDGDEEPFHQFIKFLHENDITNDANYNYVGTQIDIDNFIDFNAAQIYFANTDWPGNNVMFWRARTDKYVEGAGFKDGRWRWILKDLDYGFNLAVPIDHNTLKFATMEGGKVWPNPDWATFLLRTLLKNNNFKQDFANRFADHLNSSFLAERVIKKINEFKLQYNYEIDEHLDRWGIPDSPSAWRKNVEALRIFADKRPDIVFGQLDKQLGLGGTAQVTVNCDKSMGKVGINSIVIDSSLPGASEGLYPWSGQYFKNVPVTLTAYPGKGYKFVKWVGLSGAGDFSRTAISVNPVEGLNITAVFEKE